MVTEVLKKNIEEILARKYGKLTGEVRVAPAPPGVADFAVNAPSLKGVVSNVSPDEAAKFLVENWNAGGNLFVLKSFEKNYLNFDINTVSLVDLVLKNLKKKKDKIGDNDLKKGQKILVEYPSNNTHKDLHVGHLRHICLSQALINLFTVSGAKVIPVNYVNDFGAHVAKCLWGLQNIVDIKDAPDDKGRWLGEVYAKVNDYLREHPEKKDEIYELQKKLENRELAVMDLYKKTREWSLVGFKKIFDELDVKHDHVFYESEVKDLGQKTVDILLEKGIAQVGERGAIIVDLKKYNLDIALIRKSTGAGVYLTSDLGLAQVKNKKYPRISESLHITGTEQIFYFKQLFKILELAGFDYRMTHLSYGLVKRPDGKMSSRLGNVILYENLRDEVYGKVYEETKKRHEDWSEDKIKKISLRIALAAIRFEMLKHESAKEIIFDAQAVADFNGFTGPYILYTVARINSLFTKGKKLARKNINPQLIGEAEVKKILLQVSSLSAVVLKSLNNYNPSTLTKYTFDLAKLFNDFYNKYRILGEENEELVAARLSVSGAVKEVLEKSLSILGIETVPEM